MNHSQPFRNPLCVALDVDSVDLALDLSKKLSSVVGGVKLGPRLVHRGGSALVESLSTQLPVFVDCKFFDIPSTMISAVKTSFESGASAVTVHALAGEEALLSLAQLEKDLQKQRPFRILAVTILTSWSDKNIPSNMKPLSVGEHVRSLAELVKKSGLSSIVCSAEELPLLKDLGLYCVTPGIRLSGDSLNDQKRVATPRQARAAGASCLVVGRSIIEDKDPLKKAQLALQEITS